MNSGISGALGAMVNGILAYFKGRKEAAAKQYDVYKKYSRNIIGVAEAVIKEREFFEKFATSEAEETTNWDEYYNTILSLIDIVKGDAELANDPLLVSSVHKMEKINSDGFAALTYKTALSREIVRIVIDDFVTQGKITGNFNKLDTEHQEMLLRAQGLLNDRKGWALSMS